jgi:G2/mitotic-specific cyclin 1/2
VGITCLSIASKVEEIVAPSISHFLHCADSSYTESNILLAERYILKTIDWNSSYPNPMHFLYRMVKADDYDVKSRTMGKHWSGSCWAHHLPWLGASFSAMING